VGGVGSRLGPVGRFSLALALVLTLTAAAVAGATALLISTYVQEETAGFTERAVASHFGTIFSEDVFLRPLSDDELEELEGQVIFHFSVYNVVRTRFVDTSGRIVFSYDEDEVGEQAGVGPGLVSALGGTAVATREKVWADKRFGDPSRMRGGGYSHQGHMYPSLAGRGDWGSLPALEAWTPIRIDGAVRGAAVVWRDMTAIDAEIARITLSTSAIIALAATLLWLILRGVYVRSSQEIRERSAALASALAEVEVTYDRTLHALSNALDVRDSETEGHSRRVVEYLKLVSEELGMHDEDCVSMRRGALLHDIGKIGVPDDILRKPSALSEAEWATMRRHPSYGARIVGEIPYLQGVAKIIKHHHERWDGNGYPEGLRGEEIPLGARMFAVADAFDAMSADRPYRKALDAISARNEVLRCSGTQFDPNVVEAFMRIPLERLLAIAGASVQPAAVSIAVA
jgi:putative nucleotidyltransferase with HDIG domain